MAGGSARGLPRVHGCGPAAPAGCAAEVGPTASRERMGLGADDDLCTDPESSPPEGF